MKKLFAITLALVLCLSLLAACSGNKDKTEPDGGAETVTLKVGASPAPHAEILEAAKPILAEKGITLEIVEFTDYVQPNTAAESGEIDANYFQHKPYLNDFNAENGTHLVSVGDIHYEPFGLYPGKTATIEDLADGAQIAVPNDATNEARALLLLEAQGLIKLTEGVGLTATKLDIIENPKNLDIVEMEAAQLPRTLDSVDMAVINGNYAIEANLSVAKDAVAFEDPDSDAADTFANVICVKEGNENNDAIKTLVEVLKGAEIQKYINDTYDGAVVPAK